MRDDQGVRPPLNRRARRVLLTVGILLAGATVAWLTTLFGPPPRVTAPALEKLAPGARTPADFARLSCVHVRLAGQAIQANAPAKTVREELASARALAAEALRRDGRYAQLSGGVAALDEAVRNDNGAAASTGLTVTMNTCARLEPQAAS